MRAAFMCFSFHQSSAFADSRRGRLCDRDILFDRPRARADRSNDRAADQDRQTAAEDHDLATIALLDAEERRAWLSHSCEVRGALIEKPRRDRLTDGKSMLPIRAPSCRVKATSAPPASTTAIL